MKVEYNLDHSHFKVTCDKCNKEFSDKDVDYKEPLFYCPNCNNFICGTGYLIIRERKDYMKYGSIKQRKSSSIKRISIPKKKLIKRSKRIG
jgi:hypothetical protein